MALDGSGEARLGSVRGVRSQLGFALGGKGPGRVCGLSQAVDQREIGLALAVDVGEVGLDAPGVELAEDGVQDAGVGRRAAV